MTKTIEFIPGTEFLFDPSLRFKVLAGGRGSGKSWSVARALILEATRETTRILCCRELQLSIAESVHRLISSQINEMGLDKYWEIQRDRITNKHNGSEFLFVGVKSDPGKLKSMEGVDKCWVEEGEAISQESWDILIPTIRKPGSQFYIVYNPRYEEDPTHQMFALNPPPGTHYKVLNYMDNPFFPEVLRPQMEALKVSNPLMYEHIWEGRCVPSLSTALWSWDSIDKNRLPVGTDIDYARILVSIDPAVTANKNSDETGIVAVACSKGLPRHYYVLSDVSGRLLPEEWGRRALDTYDACEAGSLVFEVNQGGLMVAETIRNVCRSTNRPVPQMKEVRATRGKVVRAEPIAALYSQGLVHHVGAFPDLERQLLRFDPHNENQKSPDRMDALVWGLTELSSGRAPMKLALEAARLMGRRV